MANTEIRAMLKAEKIPYWRIGDKLGMHENTVIRRMRHELSEADKKEFLKAISEIMTENKKTA